MPTRQMAIADQTGQRIGAGQGLEIALIQPGAGAQIVQRLPRPG
jgi:hypothetical protein